MLNCCSERIDKVLRPTRSEGKLISLTRCDDVGEAEIAPVAHDGSGQSRAQLG